MAATLNMLAEFLGERVVHRPVKMTTRFSWVAMLSYDDELERRAERCSTCTEVCAERVTDEDVKRLRADASSDMQVVFDDGQEVDFYDQEVQGTLYCGVLSGALAFLEQHPSAYALAVVQPGAPHDCASSRAEHLLIVEDARKIVSVYEEVRRFFMRYERWTSRMRSCLFEGGGYQDFMDACAGIFKDVICVTDSGYRLMAYTRDLPIDDPVIRYLVDNGCHSDETVERFERYHAPKRWKTQVGIVRVETHRVVQNPSLSYVFRMQGSYFIHAVLQCTHSKEITDGLVDTFQIFIEHMELLVRHDWTSHHRFNKEYSSLLTDLALGEPMGDALLNAQLAQNGIEAEGEYRVVVLEFGSACDDAADRNLGYYAWRLLEFFPLGRVTVVDSDILLLLSYHSEEKHLEEISGLFDELRKVQGHFSGAFGVSERFTRIVDLKFAYRQALVAIEFGKRRASSLAASYMSLGDPRSVFSFEESFMSYVSEYGMHEAEFVRYCAHQSPLWRIMQDDLANGTDDARLLFVYLVNERRPKEAAEMLHMHRNTLVYRITRLEERYGLNLSDWIHRQMLLMVYRVVEARA